MSQSAEPIATLAKYAFFFKGWANAMHSEPVCEDPCSKE